MFNQLPVKPIILAVGLLFSWLGSAAQDKEPFSQTISGSYYNVSLEQVIADLSANHGIRFYFKPQWLNGKSISVEYSNTPLREALIKIFRGQEISFILRDPNYVVLLKDEGNSTETKTIDSKSNTNRITIGEINLDKDRATLTGVVLNGENGTPLEGAVVSIPSADIRVVTRVNGYYELTLPPGTYEVNYHHQTMEDFDIDITLNGDGKLHVDMYEDVLRLAEVVIQEEAIDQNVSETITGQEQLDVQTIKKIPAFFGEVDIVNSVLSLPGVNKVGEGTTGFNVRGGNVGQNLILIDNSSIYNSSHLFGFFSAFNADVVQNVTFYRGSIPARYGGRISSVLDVGIKNGNKKKFTGQGGVGFINSRFSIEGPIIKDSTSFIFGIRAAYPNYIIKQLQDLQLSRSAAYFVDSNFKIDHLINSKNRISLSSYFSRDRFTLSNEAEYDYGNKALGLEWNTTLGEELYVDVKSNYSLYDYILTEIQEPQLASSLSSEVEQLSGQVDFELNKGSHKLTFGSSVTHYAIKPGDYSPASDLSQIETLKIDEETGIESAVYIGDEYNFTNRLSAYLGVRYSFFDGGKSDLTDFSHGIEPRFSINLQTSSSASVKLGYNRMRQYVQFISNTTAATPIDLWKLSNTQLAPTIGDQVTLGYFKNFNSNSIETSAELFYKETIDLVEYKNGADLFINPSIEDELLQGSGRAYGLEVMVKKKQGELQGWVSYTYSRSQIKVSNSSQEESINNGAYFSTNFDQPHNLTAFMNMQLTRRFSINANFQYNTGRPITYPESVYEINGITVSNYSERNKYRIPDYHRLDLSFTFTTSLKRKKKVEANWTFSIYNVYGRNNAYSVYFKNDPLTQEPKSYKLSVIGRPILALTYNFKF